MEVELLCSLQVLGEENASKQPAVMFYGGPEFRKVAFLCETLGGERQADRDRSAPVSYASGMGDEDKKPRHRLGADELLEETQAAIGKIIALLEASGLAAESLEHLTSLIKGADFMVRRRTKTLGVQRGRPCLLSAQTG